MPDGAPNLARDAAHLKHDSTRERDTTSDRVHDVAQRKRDSERRRRKNDLVRLSSGRRQVCEDMRRQQMEKLGFQSNRTPGRLLLSLYNMHLDQVTTNETNRHVYPDLHSSFYLFVPSRHD